MQKLIYLCSPVLPSLTVLSSADKKIIVDVHNEFRSNARPTATNTVKLVCYDNVFTIQISNISHTKSQRLNVYRLVLQLSLPNQLKPDVMSKMKM